MKVIYTFKKFKHILNIENPIFLDMARLSVKYSGALYKTELYCDSESKIFFDKHNIKFNKVVVLPEIENYDGEMYAIPKMITYSKQNEPYIHLDFDTIILRRLSFNNDVTFGYYDEDYSYYDVVKYSQFALNTYINSFENYIKGYYSPNEYLQWRWLKFPNNSLLAVNNYQFVSEMYTEVLNKLKDVILYPDPETCIGQFVEQFLLIANLDLHKKSYDCVYKCNPIKILNKNNIDKLDKFKFIHLQNYKNIGSHSHNLLYALHNK